MSLLESLARGVVHTLGAIPEPLQRALAGPPVVVDGRTLFTEVQLFLRLVNALPPQPPGSQSIEVLRAQLEAEARMFGGRTRVRHVEDVEIPTRTGSVRGRVYLDDPNRRPDAAVVYLHGGGWTFGSVDSADAVCRVMAAHANVVVVSVDYRLAPEHPFPAGLEDAVDAYRWVRARPEWGEVVAVAGDSAGANLAAALCAATAGQDVPDFQLLFFPVTDITTKRRSYARFGTGFVLTEADMDWFREQYLADPSDAADPLASPLLGDPTGLPPTHVAVAGFDVLRDDGLAYAARLADAGVPVTTQSVDGHIHAFVNSTGVGRTSTAALLEAVAALRAGIVAARDR